MIGFSLVVGVATRGDADGRSSAAIVITMRRISFIVVATIECGRGMKGAHSKKIECWSGGAREGGREWGGGMERVGAR